MRAALVLTCIASALALNANGASREDSAPLSDDSAEGFWVATTPEGVHVKWAILGDGETWGLYEVQGTILGAFHGVTHAGQGALHGSGQAYDIPSNTVGATTFTGSYVPHQAIALTTAFGVNVSGHYVPGYEQPARLERLQGRFQGEGLSSRHPVIGMQMTVEADGSFIMTSREDCAASGTALPHPGGKNVFNVNLRFAGSACPLGDGAHASGIAHVSAVSGDLFVLAMNSHQTDGWLFLGSRPAD